MREGILLKMESVLDDEVRYFLPLGGDRIPMNEMIGKEVSMEYRGAIHCIRCGKLTKTSFAQGYCYPCFTTAPETSECVLRPELCRAHEGVSRDMSWSEGHCLQDHFVYLSLTSGVKVGVTRSSQIPTRWIDQGAVKAIRLAMTPNRFMAGQIEVAVKAKMSDRTNWRNMLKGEIENVDLVGVKDETADSLSPELGEFVTDDDEIMEINYPMRTYPVRVRSVGFDKNPVIEGKLEGIKGQYLCFSDGRVLNVRKHGGYLVSVSF